MTATSRKRGSWKEEKLDVGDSDKDEDDEKKASQREWQDLEKQVQKEARRQELDSGKGRAPAAAYDDVADDEPSEDEEDASAPSSPEAEDASDADAPAAPFPLRRKVPLDKDKDDDRVVPEGVTTAGDQAKDKKRGGEKKTGATRRKKKHAGEDGPPPKKKKDDDPDRWLKMKLEGEEKPKKIDATRVVHYHDFDSSLQGPLAESAEADSAVKSEEKPAVAPSGSFRASLRRDLFDGSDSDEE